MLSSKLERSALNTLAARRLTLHGRDRNISKLRWWALPDAKQNPGLPRACRWPPTAAATSSPSSETRKHRRLLDEPPLSAGSYPNSFCAKMARAALKLKTTHLESQEPRKLVSTGSSSMRFRCAPAAFPACLVCTWLSVAWCTKLPVWVAN